jgi:NADPH:quinone reductase-like Zn-dependent oxidoreductase
VGVAFEAHLGQVDLVYGGTLAASSMRAAVTTRYGPPEVVEVREVPIPTPKDDEVLVRVRASSVCFGDRIFLSGPLLIRLLSGFRPRHPILGVDLAGTVETVGPGVTRFAPGDAVYGARGPISSSSRS